MLHFCWVYIEQTILKYRNRVYRSCRLCRPHPTIDCGQGTREMESIPILPSMNEELTSDPKAILKRMVNGVGGHVNCPLE